MNKNKGTAVTNALVIALIILALFLNIVFAAVVDRYSLKLDMTTNQMFELSDATVDIISGLDTSVEVTVFAIEEDYIEILREYFNRYKALNSNFKLSYVNPYQNPALLEQYKSEGITITDGMVVFEGPVRQWVLAPTDFYIFDSGGNPVSVHAEQSITSAVLRVINEELPLALFSDGHDEKPTNALANIFYDNNFLVSNLSLAVQDIHEKCEIFVIASPSRDFQPDEIEKLDAYMARGGKIMAFFEPAVDEMPNLEGFLREWGIGLSNYVVVEPELYVGTNPLFIHAQYAQHEVNAYFAENRYFGVMPASRVLEMLFSTQNDVVVESLLYSSPNAFGKDTRTMTSVDREEGDPKGPFYLALVAKKMVSTPSGVETARIFVAGSKNMYDDGVMQVSTYANAEFLTEVVNWLYESEIGISIPPKSLFPPSLNITNAQIRILSIIFVIVIPITITGFGIYLYFRRRHL